jgi:type VI protein secretion system component Hcp
MISYPSARVPRVVLAAFLGVCLASIIPSAVAQAPTIVTPPQSNEARVGDSATFAVSATGDQPFTYSWLYSGSNTSAPPVSPRSSDTTAATLTINGVQLSDQGQYWVTVSNANGNAISSHAYLSVYGFLLQPRSETVCAGTELTLSASAVNGGYNTYQWYKNSVAVPGATGNALTFASVQMTDAGNYWLVADTPAGPITSLSVTLTVNPPPPFAGGSGTSSDPYQIVTVAQLDGVRTQMDKCFVLKNDIDLSGQRFFPIGNSNTVFSGTFDGQGHAIRNWIYDDRQQHPSDYSGMFPPSRTGLFRALSSTAQIANVAMVGCQVTGADVVGILLGECRGSVNNCSSAGTVWGRAVGGLVGANYGDILWSSSSATIASDSQGLYGYFGPQIDVNCGGLVAYNSGRILDSYAAGSITSANSMSSCTSGGLVSFNSGSIVRCRASGSVAGYLGVGGLVGTSPGSIDRCSATGAVTGTDVETGGLVGRGSISSILSGSAYKAPVGTISNSYATGSVQGSGNMSNINYVSIGGLVGRGVASLVNCYSTGMVSRIGPTLPTMGGLIGGTNIPAGWQSTPSYWNMETGQLTQSVAGYGLSTSQMQDQNSYAGWDFTNIWMMGPDGYPILLANTRASVSSFNPKKISGSDAFALTVNGSGFVNGATVEWNGSARPTTFISSTSLAAAIPASDLEVSNDVTVVLISVRNPYCIDSNVMAFPVVTDIVTAVQCGVSSAGSFATVTTAPTSANVGGVTATLQHAGTSFATVAVANYSQTPASVSSIEVGGLLSGVQVANADPADIAAAYFYYSSKITGGAENGLLLQFFDGNSWQPVLSSGSAAPVLDTTNNLNGTVSGGCFTVVFDQTSTPRITELANTIFNIGLSDSMPPVIQSVTASPFLLLPANRQMVPVTITVVATDNIDPQPKCRIVSVTSNEPVSGGGRCDLNPDWVITGDLTLNLRAELADHSDGRIYTITVEARDASGNASTQATTVVVPKDRDADKDRPDIISQPRDQKVKEGADATFTVAVAPALPVTYQWRFNKAPISGATAASLTLHNVTWSNGGDYSVTVTNSVGATKSDTAELTVIPYAPVITGDPQSQTVNSGGSVVFGVTVTSSAPLSYQWYCNGRKMAREQQATLTLCRVDRDDAGAYSVTVSNDGGSATSAAANLTVVTPPQITSQPGDQKVTEGNAATFSVKATSSVPLTYQWNFNGKPMPSATSATLTLNNVTVANAGCYTATATNSAGSTTSESAKLTVLPRAPVIKADPQAQSVASGSSVTFTVTATSSVPLSYQWLCNGRKMACADQATLVLRNVELTDAGSYAVTVSNDGGSVTSAAAKLTVVAPTITALSPNTVNADSGAFTLTVTGTGFVAGDVVKLNCDTLSTKFVSNTVLTATVPACSVADFRCAKTVLITVQSPAGDPSTTAATLTVVAAAIKH